MANIHQDITSLIGNTPLVKLNRLAENLGAEILLKLECFNPYCSIKDRIALSMIETAEREGKLKQGDVIVESTSGNTGIGLAYIAAVKGYEIILTMPDTMTLERRNLLKALGAKLELTPGEDGMKACMQLADDIAKELPNAWQPNQFENQANPQVHYDTTGPEIWNDTDGRVDVFVSGVGTGGTLTGTGRFLKEKNPNVHLVAVEPTDSAILSGGEPGLHKIQGIGAGFVPDIYDESIADEVICVSNEDAFETTRCLARHEGLFVGISAGAIAKAALEIATRPEFAGKRIVAIAPDFGERYLSNPVFAELEVKAELRLAV